MSKNLLTCKQAAQYLGLSVQTLAKWRCYRVPGKPPWIDCGRAIRYSVEDLDTWIRGKRCEVLSDGMNRRDANRTLDELGL